MGIFNGMKKNGKMIGIGPLLISTIVADSLVGYMLYSFLESLF